MTAKSSRSWHLRSWCSQLAEKCSSHFALSFSSSFRLRRPGTVRSTWPLNRWPLLWIPACEPQTRVIPGDLHILTYFLSLFIIGLMVTAAILLKFRDIVAYFLWVYPSSLVWNKLFRSSSFPIILRHTWDRAAAGPGYDMSPALVGLLSRTCTSTFGIRSSSLRCDFHISSTRTWLIQITLSLWIQEGE